MGVLRRMFASRERGGAKQAIGAFTGDIHANSTVAVCPPRFTKDDGGTYGQSESQAFLNEKWVEYWDEIWALKKELKWPLYVVLHGELADSNYHATSQLISRNEADQIRLASKVLERPVDMADYLFVIRGSEAHSGGSGWIDEKMAADFGAIGPPEFKGEIRSWFIWRGVIGGVRFDVSHHPGTGHRVPWTAGADANRLAAMVMHRYDKYNAAMEAQGNQENMQPMPHIVIRGHNHRPSDSYDNHPVRAIILPSWQLSTAFGHRLGGDWLPFGGSYIVCDDGKATVEKKFWQWPISDYWRAELDYKEGQK